MYRGEVYRRPDGRWDWRLKSANGQIVATSGGQGYERPGRAEDMLRRMIENVYVQRRLEQPLRVKVVV